MGCGLPFPSERLTRGGLECLQSFYSFYYFSFFFSLFSLFWWSDTRVTNNISTCRSEFFYYGSWAEQGMPRRSSRTCHENHWTENGIMSELSIYESVFVKMDEFSLKLKSTYIIIVQSTEYSVYMCFRPAVAIPSRDSNRLGIDSTFGVPIEKKWIQKSTDRKSLRASRPNPHR